MMGRSIQMRQLTQIVALVVLGLVWGASNEAGAAEQRCDALGANCVCSEPLNTPTLVQDPQIPGNWNPADSITKECTYERAHHPIQATGDKLRMVSNEQANAALPAGHTNTYVLRGTEGHQGIWFLGHIFKYAPEGGAATVGLKRTAARFYRYYSPNFEFAFEGTCGNTKIFYFDTEPGGSGTVIDGAYQPPHMYNHLNWTPPIDCCLHGPAGPEVNFMTKSWLRGKWIRYEVVMTNRTGGPAPNNVRIKMYQKDVTNNGPEYTVIDDSVATAEWNPTIIRQLPRRNDHFAASLFRSLGNATSGACNGYSAISHFMLAGWDTDSGQRIGAASEIEGGGGDSQAPLAPLNLRITQLMDEE